MHFSTNRESISKYNFRWGIHKHQTLQFFHVPTRGVYTTQSDITNTYTEHKLVKNTTITHSFQTTTCTILNNNLINLIHTFCQDLVFIMYRIIYITCVIIIWQLQNNSNENESALARDNSKQNNESITLKMGNVFHHESYGSEQDDIMTIFGTRWRIDQLQILWFGPFRIHQNLVNQSKTISKSEEVKVWFNIK